ncbi:type II toxin-antitoxin system antitoxin, TscA family [Staphylococcus nepalensis]|uniref:TscA family type II toxin-antitoxin system antitoxin n=1 Tax=Staphylococcus nepalensis TaxID=214473 RepID=UPI003CEA7304
MEAKHKYQLSKVINQIDDVITNTEEIKNAYNYVSNETINTEQLLEKVLKNIATNIGNVWFKTNFNTTEYDVLNEILKTLHTVKKDDSQEYSVTILDAQGQHDEIENREQFLLGILEWASEYITENINLNLSEEL